MRPTSWMMKLLFAALTLFSFLVTAIPIGNPTAPSLTGIKYSTSVQLDWNSINSCNSATYEIQESTNGSLWSTVYTGAGNSGGGSASFTSSASKAIGGGCNVVGGGPRFISLSSRTNAVYYYKIRACELGRCGQYGSTLQLGQVTTPPPPPTPSIVIEQLSYHIYQDSNGKLYLVRPPIFVPIAGEIFIPIFLADKGNVIVMTESGGTWTLSEITYDQFLATNAVKKEQAAVRYQNLEGGTDIDFVISLDGQFNNSYVVSDINANVHTVTEQDISAEAWRSIAYTAVDNAAGSNTAPSETIDLSASVLKGHAGVSGGQASYQIPIDLPPGRNGIQPKVSLSYNSQGGNGIAGVGWSLNAGSAISRCGATYAQDGFTRAVTFNADTDRLCFNGQRLITSGSYGTSGTEYRTEMDSFVKVVQSGEINGTSTSFTVSRPDGSTATYGADANSRFAPAGLTTSLTWKVTQESWANGNNTIDYEYDTSVAGEHLLSDIYYTGGNGIKGNRNVRLIYGDRTDRKRSYQSKGYSQQTRVLERIATYQTGTNVRNYYLNYVQSDASQRSLLTSIKECATYSATSQCKPLTNFAWNQSQSDFVLDKLAYSDVFNTAQKIDTVLPKGDVNGDGVKDLPEVYINAESSVTGNHSEYYKSCNINLVMTGRQCISWDANNDGRTDSQFVVNGYLNIRLTLAGQNNFRNIATNIELNFQQTGIQQDTILNASDYNGDGFTDITIYRYDDGNPKVYLYKHTGNINSPYLDNGQVVFNLGAIPTSESDPLLKNEVSSVGDFDGNGFPDLLVSRKVIYSNSSGTINTPSSMPVGVVLSKDSGSFEYVELDFSVPKMIDNLYFFNLFIDLNSDGLVDWLGWKPEWTGGGSKPIHYRINKGGILSEYKALDGVTLPSRSYIAGFEGSSNEFSEGYSFFVPKFGSSLHVMDIDGDAIPELLVPDERLIEGCANIKVPSWSQHRMVDKAMCGDELYGEYYPSYTFDRDILVRETSLIPVERLDSSVYSYKALKLSASNIDIALLTGQFIPTSIIATSSEASVTDINGDGLNDFMFVSPDPASKFTWRKPSNHDIDGFVGDGTFVNRNYGAGTGQTSSDYAATDYLQSVTDGIGNQSQWRYRPLSTGEGSAGQTKMYHTDHDYVGDGYIHFGSSMYVVQSFEQSDGISGTNETEYAYKGAMYNLQGRGFTGFREIIEKDVARNRVTTSVFKQKFPEVSLLESQTIKIDGTTVATTQQTWAENPQHNISGVFHNINTSTITHSYGLSGSSEQRSSVEQTIDTADVTQHGNIKKRTKTVTDYIDGSANSYQTVVDTVFIPDTNNWFLGKFESKTTTTSVTARGWASDPYANTDTEQWQTLTVDSWDAEHHKPTQATYTASGSSCDRVETTTLNDYGLPTQVSVTGESSSCGALTARGTSFTYTKNGSSQADDGYLPYQITNAKGHISKTEYDMGLGVPIKVTAPNSIITQTQYDAIGRPVQVSQTGSPTRYLRYLLASSGSHAPTHAKLMTRTTSAGMPSQETYLDSLGRSLRSATQAFDGSNYQYLDKKYDSLGHLTHESLPYYDGNTPEYTIFSGFDGFDRPTNRSLPNGESGGLISTYSYTGLKTDISVEGRTMSRTYGMQGLLYETVDAAGGSNRFAYDGAGRPLIIQDANNSKIVASYNGFGHKTQVIDPNQGTTTFGYNTLGELDSQTDANQVTQSFTLDTLGRITAKTLSSNANGSASYIWDTLKQGMLSRETQNGITRSYTYTSNLQLATSSVKVGTSAGGDNVTRTVKHQYDSFYGRPKALTYPNNLTLEYRYNDTGYLNQTRNAASGYVYRTVTEMDAAGHLTGSQMANALLTQSSSYNSEGTMASTQVTSSLGLLHQHYYEQYDNFMNLTAERNAVTGLEKSYVYDNLNRLEQYSFSNAGFAIYDSATPFAATVDYGYDAVGNLLKKSDYSINSNSAYEYGGSCGGPNRVCAITKELNHQRVTFSYDSRGNLLVGDDLTMTYNALDKPLSIIGRGPGNNTNTAFVYGSDNMRALQTRTVSGTTTKTHYIDKLFETDNDGSWRAYISDIAVLSYTPQKSHQLLYTLRDRLGSATTMVDHQGNEISRRYFDPFGRTATETAVGSFGDLLDTNRNRRGFTDHEHLNEQKLIHMNGRVYDYNMGRFMSVDPFIQAPTSTQSVNPYSYIMNNPLSGTDPTGYEANFIAGASFGSNVNLTDDQVSLLIQADNCTFCDGQFGGGVDVGNQLQTSYAATGSVTATLFGIAKAKALGGKPRKKNGHNKSVKSDKTSEIGDKKSNNTDQDMVNNLVTERRNTGDNGNATFGQGRDGDGNLTPVRQSLPGTTSARDVHAETQVLKDLEGTRKPHTVAVDQTPCSNCSTNLSNAKVDKVIVPMQPEKPQGSPKSAARGAASRGKTVVPKVVRVFGRLDSKKLDKK